MMNTCCFFGHNETEETEELRKRLYKIVENLVVTKNIDIFLFGSKSKFDDLSHEIVSDIKKLILI